MEDAHLASSVTWHSEYGKSWDALGVLCYNVTK
jgi:hypothetical protein